MFVPVTGAKVASPSLQVISFAIWRHDSVRGNGLSAVCNQVKPRQSNRSYYCPRCTPPPRIENHNIEVFGNREIWNFKVQICNADNIVQHVPEQPRATKTPFG